MKGYHFREIEKGNKTHFDLSIENGNDGLFRAGHFADLRYFCVQYLVKSELQKTSKNYSLRRLNKNLIY